MVFGWRELENISCKITFLFDIFNSLTLHGFKFVCIFKNLYAYISFSILFQLLDLKQYNNYYEDKETEIILRFLSIFNLRIYLLRVNRVCSMF